MRLRRAGMHAGCQGMPSVPAGDSLRHALPGVASRRRREGGDHGRIQKQAGVHRLQILRLWEWYLPVLDFLHVPSRLQERPA